LVSPSSRPCQLSASMVDVLSETCKFISQWMDSNTCGVRNSMECCKGLVILFSYLAQTEQFLTVNDWVVGSLALMRESCIRAGWEAAQGDSNFRFSEALRQGTHSKSLPVVVILSVSSFCTGKAVTIQ
ncbi:hypothetical protein PAXRUDRAFT_140802, partial [Paxillus rubicundulus Ve08.2h10]